MERLLVEINQLGAALAAQFNPETLCSFRYPSVSAPGA